METLAFNTRVLGPKAAERLKAKQVTQTLRSAHNRAITKGDLIKVTLDGRLVGYAYLAIWDVVMWADLDIDDAKRGGFDNRLELGSALRRAGFRFKSIADYEFSRLQFTWQEYDGAGVPAEPESSALKASSQVPRGEG